MSNIKSIAKKISVRNKNIYIPLIITGILSFCMLFPVIAMAITLFHTPVFYGIESLFGGITTLYSFIISGGISLLAMYLFYASESIVNKIAANIIAVLFMLPILMNLIDYFIEYESFWVPYLSATLGSGAILIGVASFKLINSSK